MAETRAPGFLLARAHETLRMRMIAALDGSGLHLGHVAILGALATSNGLSQRELTARTGIEKSSMVLFVDLLERDGWVIRARNPEDRRAHRVLLTESGATRLAQIGPRLAATEAAFLAPLAAEEVATLTTLLARLVAAS